MFYKFINNYILYLFYIIRQPTRIYSSLNRSAQSSKQIPSIKIEKFNPLWMFVGSTGCIGFRYFLNGNNIVHCEHREVKKVLDENFDWNKLLSYLSPDLFNLLAAIIVSILILNFKYL